jgi:hypothetical protein
MLPGAAIGASLGLVSMFGAWFSDLGIEIVVAIVFLGLATALGAAGGAAISAIVAVVGTGSHNDHPPKSDTVR